MQLARGSGLLGFSNNWNVPNLLAYSFADARSPNVSREEHFDRGSQRNGEHGSKQTANQQSPDKNRDDDGHGMQPNGFPDNERGVIQPFEILHDYKYYSNNERLRPFDPLKRRTEDGRHP